MTMDHARDLGEPAVDSAAMNLGDEIQRARHRARLTQTDVADRLGVGVSTVSNWERGNTVPKNRLQPLRDLLGMDPGDDAVTTTHPDDLAAISNVELIAELARRLGHTETTGRTTSRITGGKPERVTWRTADGPTARAATKSGDGLRKRHDRA